MALRAYEVSIRLILVCAVAVVALSPVEAQHLTPTGAEFQVNAFTPGAQNYPEIAADGDGDFVVIWESDPDGGNNEIFGRRFDSAGTALGLDFQVNTHTLSHQIRPALASAADGSFVVAWNGYGQDGYGTGIFARRFSSDGTPQATEFQVNGYTASYQLAPAVAADADGDFVIAWTSNGQDGFVGGIFARRFSSDGAALGGEFQVNTFSANHQGSASVSSHSGGDFVIVWVEGGFGSPVDVVGRRFDSAGFPQASEFLANSSTAGTQAKPDVAHDSAGGFVIAWSSFGQNSDERAIFARRFDSNGAAQGGDFQVHLFAGGYQDRARLAFDSADDLVVVWRGDGPFGDFEVFARAFDSAGMPKGGALSDGLLVLRYLFGFSGTTLTTGAVASGCSRCDADAIVPYLQTLD